MRSTIPSASRRVPISSVCTRWPAEPSVVPRRLVRRSGGDLEKGATMRFAILMTDGGGAWDALTSAQQAEVMEKHREFQVALEADGRYVASYCLAPEAQARTVRRDAGGRTLITDGPFAE